MHVSVDDRQFENKGTSVHMLLGHNLVIYRPLSINQVHMKGHRSDKHWAMSGQRNENGDNPIGKIHRLRIGKKQRLWKVRVYWLHCQADP